MFTYYVLTNVNFCNFFVIKKKLLIWKCHYQVYAQRVELTVNRVKVHISILKVHNNTLKAHIEYIVAFETSDGLPDLFLCKLYACICQTLFSLRHQS